MYTQEIITPAGQTRYLVIRGNGEVIRPVARYLKYLDKIGRAQNTLRAYANDLRLFFQYAEDNQVDYQTVTLDEMAGFVLWLKTPHQSVDLLPSLPVKQARTNRTINRCLAAVTGFYDYLWRQQDLATDLHPATHELRAKQHSFKGFLHHIATNRLVDTSILMQATGRTLPKTLPKDQVAALVGACCNRRDKLLLTLLYESSLRVGEALALWLEDVDIPACRLHVRDRGSLVNGAEIKTPSSVRSVDVSRGLLNQTLDYIAQVHTDDVETNHLFIKLFGPRAGKPLTYGDVNDLFKRLERKTGIHGSAHVLRHSSLTALAGAGVMPEHLSKRAGHAHFHTTYQMYVHPSDDDLRADWERAEEAICLANSEIEE